MKKNVQKSSSGKPAKSKGYKLSTAPVARSRQVAGTTPKVTQASDRIRVSNREYITDISTINGFTLNLNRIINPGSSILFPWLAPIAQRYEKYSFKSLKFCFESTSSTNTGGSVILAVDPDSSDAPPANKQQMLAWRMSNRSAPWDRSTLECKSICSLPPLYVLYGSVQPANTDIKSYSIGTFYCGTQAAAVVSDVGELYVEYVVDLMIPNQEVPPVVSGGVVPTATTGMAGSSMFGSVAPKILANIPIKWNAGTNTMNLSAVGDILVDLVGKSSGAMGAQGALTALFADGVSRLIAPINGSTANPTGAGQYFSYKYLIDNAWGDMVVSFPTLSGVDTTMNPSVRLSTFASAFQSAI